MVSDSQRIITKQWLLLWIEFFFIMSWNHAVNDTAATLFIVKNFIKGSTLFACSARHTHCSIYAGVLQIDIVIVFCHEESSVTCNDVIVKTLRWHNCQLRSKLGMTSSLVLRIFLVTSSLAIISMTSLCYRILCVCDMIYYVIIGFALFYWMMTNLIDWMNNRPSIVPCSTVVLLP